MAKIFQSKAAAGKWYRESDLRNVGGEYGFRSMGGGVVYAQYTRRQNQKRYGRMLQRARLDAALKPVTGSDWVLLPLPR